MGKRRGGGGGGNVGDRRAAGLLGRPSFSCVFLSVTINTLTD